MQTGVSFDNNRITAPLAFTGSYASPFGCLRFSGWAQSNFEMRFDAQNQAVFGQLNVETVNLDGVNPVVSGTRDAARAIDIEHACQSDQDLDGRQIAVNLPVAAANGNLQAAGNGRACRGERQGVESVRYLRLRGRAVDDRITVVTLTGFGTFHRILTSAMTNKLFLLAVIISDAFSDAAWSTVHEGRDRAGTNSNSPCFQLTRTRL